MDDNELNSKTLHISNEIIKKEISDYLSLSISSFSNIKNGSSFINPESFNIDILLPDEEPHRIIQKYNKTGNACSVMRCLSRIEPLAIYFTNKINYVIFILSIF